MLCARDLPEVTDGAGDDSKPVAAISAASKRSSSRSRFGRLRFRIAACQVSLYNRGVIASFRHRGLKRFFSGDERKIESSLRERVRDILSLLDVCTSTAELGRPAYRLHPLKGDRQGYWSMTVSGNWRIVFRFDDHGNVVDVDLVDYH